MMAPTPNPTPTANAGIAALAPKATPQQVPQQAGGSGDLMQVQAQLRSLPAGDPRTMQLLTSYANGANPMVPQFLALGEIKRREQMMQQPAQPPQGTVKDKVEQTAGIMATQQARQQQAMQALAGQAAQAPGPVPQGTPQPEVNMAEGGVVALPVRNEMFNYAGGGIVAFNGKDNEQLVDDEYKVKGMETGNRYKEEMEKAKRNPAGESVSDIQKALAFLSAPLAAGVDVAALPITGLMNMVRNPLDKSERPSITPASDARRRFLYGEDKPEGPKYDASTQEKGAAELAALRDAAAAQADIEGATQTQRQGSSVAQGPRVPSGGPVTARPPAVRPATQGGISDLMPMSPEARRAEMMKNPEIAEALKGKAGEGMAAILDTIAKNDELAKQRFKQQEDRNQLDAISSALIAAGKGTAGKRGFLGQLGGALGSGGESLVASNAAAAERAGKREALEREQTLNMGKLREEIAAKRRAEAEGRIGDMEKHDQKIAELKVKLSEGELDRANRLAVANITANASMSRAGDPATALRMKYLDQQQDSLVAELGKIPPYLVAQRKPIEDKLATVRKELAKLTGLDTMGATPGTTGGKVVDWNSIGK